VGRRRKERARDRRLKGRVRIERLRVCRVLLSGFRFSHLFCRTRYFCYPTSRRVSVFSRLSLYNRRLDSFETISAERELRTFGKETSILHRFGKQTSGLKASGGG